MADDQHALVQRLAELEAENARLRQRVSAVEKTPFDHNHQHDKAWLRLALDSAAMGLWSCDSPANVVRWSDQVHTLLGLTATERGGTYESYVALIPTEERPLIEKAIADCLSGQTTDHYSVIHRVVRSDGSTRWIEARGRLLRDPAGSPLQLTGTVMDITNRRSADEQLHASREELRSVLETVPDFIVRVDDQRHIRFVNRTHPGMTAEQFIGTDVRNYVAPESREAFNQAMDLAVRDQRQIELNTIGIGAHGEHLHFLSRIGPLARADGGIDLIVVGTDISPLVNAQHAQRDSDARLRSAAESLPFTFWVRDVHGIMVVQNERSRREWGDQIGKSLDDMAIPEDLKALALTNVKRAMAGEVVHQEFSRDHDGDQRFYHVIIAPVRDGGQIRGVLGVDIDVSDRHRLEERLAQAEKIESIGRLAGGVAHDFNNLLTAIIGFADLAEHHLPSGTPARIAVERIRDAGERGAALTQQLLGFARKQVIRPRSVTANDLVRRASELLPRLIGEDVALVLDLADGLPPVTVDPHQFDQVLVNLAINARDAMPTGGRLAIATSVTTATPEDLRRHPDVREGVYVRIDVSDTGTGITADVMQRMFEPFYTTKPIGQGTGLGLATCDGIVRQNHGWISVTSGIGIGTTFSLHLPASHGSASAAPRTARLSKPTGGNETILVVEDEALIRVMLSETLTSLGYTVLSAADGIAALDLAASHAGTIDLLLSDVIMPRLGGPETAVRLRALRPTIKVLFASGYAEDAVARQGHIAPDASFISKPYTVGSLAARIRDILA